MKNDKYNLAALPIHAPISNIDLDVTKNCNLRCIYCFKGEKQKANMPFEVAKEAVDWLFAAAEEVNPVWLNFMGGEPLLRFNDLIKPIVEYAKLKAAQVGKHIQVSATTNCTLLTDKIIDFWDRWGNGWLLSIDGPPEIQDKQRPFADGRGSAKIVEENARRVLAKRPNVAARSTFIPQNIQLLSETFDYFLELGFKSIIIAMACPDEWQKEHYIELDKQLEKIRKKVERSYENKTPLSYRAFDYLAAKLLLNPEQIPFTPMCCGAGRGMAMIDYNGDIWPCHRFDGADKDACANGQFRLGNIFTQFNHELHLAFLTMNFAREAKPKCRHCPAYMICGFGCPAGNLQETGHPYFCHPTYCKIFHIKLKHTKMLYTALKDNQLFIEQIKKFLT